MKNKIFGLFLLLNVLVNAQFITVQDTALRNYLCENFPLAHNANCELDTVKSQTIYANNNIRIEIIGSSITKADEVFYFKTEDSLLIYLKNSKISSIPSDLRAHMPIQRLDLTGNRLTNLPLYLNKIDDKGVEQGIRLVYFESNNLDELPSSWAVENNYIHVLDIRNNNLTEIPNITKYGSLRRLNFQLNFLDFDDLLPLKNMPKLPQAKLELFPQKAFALKDIPNEVVIGQNVEFIWSNKSEGNTYSLMKNNVKIEENAMGSFLVSFDDLSDSGKYSIKVTNKNFTKSDEFLNSVEYPIAVKIQDVTVKNDIIIFSPNGDGVEDYIEIKGSGFCQIKDKNGETVVSFELPFIWNGTDRKGKVLDPGLFFIQKAVEHIGYVLIAY